MIECIGDLADDLHPDALPKLYRSRIRTHYKVELHRGESQTSRLIERELRHLSSDSLSRHAGCDHVCPVADVRAESGIVWFQPECSDDFSVLFRDVNMFLRC